MSEALTARTITISGDRCDEIEAYCAVPEDGAAARGSVVVIHHLPGYDSATKEIVRKFAAYGYAAIMPNLYYREAPGASSQPAVGRGRGLLRSRHRQPAGAGHAFFAVDRPSYRPVAAVDGWTKIWDFYGRHL